MKIKKIFLMSILFFAILTVGAFNVGAEGNDTFDELTSNEKETLLNSNFTEEQINSFSLKIARELIAEGAVSHSFVSDIVSFSEKSDEITTLGTISDSRMAMSMSGAQVTSDRAGSKKFRILGAYRWLNAPNVAFKDSVALGWSNTANLTIPTSNNKPLNYLNENYETAGLNGRFLRSSISTPDIINNSSGIGNHFPIGAGSAGYDGTISVYVYTVNKTGAFNTYFTYGNSTLKATPTFNNSSGWLGITPGLSTDTKWIMDETQF